ncbi:hypothetical protein [Glutamicibacter mysorens]|uniref:hypothetical protein n=1 Tax=Glutamicibacter mysorens TaxID=257984 RepID=UPI0020C71A5D|nr:hypothetical protein [Glutamicibacter mysorens]UTM47942.1 hypothetical protein XH9_03780 [Glutamicibacter mysorens]
MGKLVVRGFGARAHLGAAMCAAVLLMSGCSSPEAEVGASPVAQVRLDGAQLENLLEEFAQEEKNSEVISDKQLRENIPQAQEWIENVKVNPSKCGVTFAEPVADQLRNATMGAIEFEDSYLTVAIYKDSEFLQAQWDAKTAANADCARYTVKRGNETRAYHLAKQPIDSSAGLSDGYVITSSDGSSTQQQLIIRTASSNVLLGLQRSTSAGNTANEVEEASEILQKLMGHLTQ